jgi:hypothetical protein
VTGDTIHNAHIELTKLNETYINTNHVQSNSETTLLAINKFDNNIIHAITLKQHTVHIHTLQRT